MELPLPLIVLSLLIGGAATPVPHLGESITAKAFEGNEGGAQTADEWRLGVHGASREVSQDHVFRFAPIPQDAEVAETRLIVRKVTDGVEWQHRLPIPFDNIVGNAFVYLPDQQATRAAGYLALLSDKSNGVLCAAGEPNQEPRVVTVSPGKWRIEDAAFEPSGTVDVLLRSLDRSRIVLVQGRTTSADEDGVSPHAFEQQDLGDADGDYYHATFLDVASGDAADGTVGIVTISLESSSQVGGSRARLDYFAQVESKWGSRASATFAVDGRRSELQGANISAAQGTPRGAVIDVAIGIPRSDDGLGRVLLISIATNGRQEVEYRNVARPRWIGPNAANATGFGSLVAVVDGDSELQKPAEGGTARSLIGVQAGLDKYSGLVMYADPERPPAWRRDTVVPDAVMMRLAEARVVGEKVIELAEFYPLRREPTLRRGWQHRILDARSGEVLRTTSF